MFIVDGNEDETLVCHVCRKPFASLETAWLASRTTGGTAIWTHRSCIDGHAQAVLGASEFRLRRGDFAMKAVIETLLRPPISQAALRDWPRAQALGTSR